MRRRALIALSAAALVAAVAAGLLAAFARGNEGRIFSKRERAELSRLTADGTPFPLPASAARQAEDLSRGGFKTFWLLASRGGRNILRVQTASGRDCFAAGPVGNLTDPIGIVSCRAEPPYFPSPQLPILDMSIVGADAPERSLQFKLIEGVAADGVASVHALDAERNVVLEIPVKSNVYFAESSRVPLGVMTLEVVDSSGSVLMTYPR